MFSKIIEILKLLTIYEGWMLNKSLKVIVSLT